MSTHRRWYRCLLMIEATVGINAAAGLALAQQVAPTLISEDPTCPSCTVRLTTLFIAGGASGSVKFAAPPAAVVVDHAQRYWVLGSGVPIVFDSTGREAGSVTMSRERGGGFRYPYDAVAVGDSVVILDQMSQAVAVFGPDLRWMRDIKFDVPVTRAKILRWPDLVIGVGLLPMPGARGWPLHRISLRTGEPIVLSSFGPGNGQIRAASSETRDQFVAPGRRGEFWTFQSALYRLVHWDSAQRAVQVFDRRPAWFPETAQPTLGGARVPPSPAVSAVQVDSAGLLWVFISLASERWPSAWPPAQPGLSEVSPSAVALEKLYRTAIEVIDPTIGRVVTRAFTDVWIPLALADHRAVTYTVDGAGRKRLSVVALSIDRGDTRPP